MLLLGYGTIRQFTPDLKCHANLPPGLLFVVKTINGGMDSKRQCSAVSSPFFFFKLEVFRALLLNGEAYTMSKTGGAQVALAELKILIAIENKRNKAVRLQNANSV